MIQEGQKKLHNDAVQGRFFTASTQSLNTKTSDVNVSNNAGSSE